MSAATIAAPEDLKPARRLVSVPEYWKLPEEPPSFLEMTRQMKARGEPLGLWGVEREQRIPAWLEQQILHDRAVINKLVERDVVAILTQQQPERLYVKRDGLTFVITPDNRVVHLASELFAKNIITDNGATSLLKNLWNNAGSAVTIANHILIAFGNQGCSTVTTALTAGQTAVTAIACAALPAAIAAGTVITVSYGTANADTFTVAAGGAASGATSIPVNSQTSTHAHAIGDNIVPVPTTSDNPSTLANSADSGALPSGDFAFSGTGAGNRSDTITFTYGTSTTAGNYTEAFTTNAATMAANASMQHLIFPPQTINGTTSLTLTVVNKL